MGEPSGDPQGQLNVLGLPIEPCCQDPVTGFFRDGHCHTGPLDHGMHTVCAEMTEGFLNFSVAAGNDLVTPMPQYGFPGLSAGDRWCLCALRWAQAYEAGRSPALFESDAQKDPGGGLAGRPKRIRPRHFLTSGGVSERFLGV